MGKIDGDEIWNEPRDGAIKLWNGEIGSLSINYLTAICESYGGAAEEPPRRAPKAAQERIWEATGDVPSCCWLLAVDGTKSMVLGDYGTVWDKRGHF